MSKHRKNQHHRAQRSRKAPVKYEAHEIAIVDHIARYVAPPAFVIHENESEIAHLDVHVVPPGPGRDYYFLFTTGMSALPMTKPCGAPGSRFAEVSLALPSFWQLDHGSLRGDPSWSWPIIELKSAALMSHRHKTWLGPGHTITSAPPGPFDPSTRLSSLLVMEPQLLPEPARTVHIGNLDVDLLSVWPLYPEELAYRFDHGVEALVEALVHVGASDVMDVRRPSAARMGSFARDQMLSECRT